MYKKLLLKVLNSISNRAELENLKKDNVELKEEYRLIEQDMVLSIKDHKVVSESLRIVSNSLNVSVDQASEYKVSLDKIKLELNQARDLLSSTLLKRYPLSCNVVQLSSEVDYKINHLTRDNNTLSFKRNILFVLLITSFAVNLTFL